MGAREPIEISPAITRDETELPWLKAQARKTPQATALVCEQGTFSYAELARGAEAVACRLSAAGFARGQPLAFLAIPSRRYVELVYAAQQAGVVLVPLNERLTVPELACQLEHAAPAWLLHDEAHAETALRLTARLPRLRAVGVNKELEDMPASATLPGRIDPAAPYFVIYTSGTTGVPKGVVLTNKNLFTSAVAVGERLACAAGERWLAVLPLYHVGGLCILFRALIHAMAVVLQPRFEPQAAIRAIREQGVALVSLVPTMLSRMLDCAPGGAFPSILRGAVLGGGPVPAALVTRAEGCGVPVFTTYGLTEAASQVTTTAPGEAARHPGAAGCPLDGFALRIDKPDRSGCGEILVKGPQVTPGYLRNPEATAAAMVGGWLHTGDIGRLDDGGRLWVLTRRTDLIVTGGENVTPEEVEAILEQHPDIVEAAVFGMPDDTWGQQVAAAVVLRHEAELDADELRSWCRQRLASYKIPRSFAAVPALPRTAAGKLQRQHLR